MKSLVLTILVAVMFVSLVAGCGGAPVEPTAEIVELEMYSAPIGTPPYQMAVVLSGMLKEFHPWLRATPIETLGCAEAIETSYKFPLERKKYVIMYGGSLPDVVNAQEGNPPYGKKYPDLKLIGKKDTSAKAFCTYDPEIRTPEDIIGKRVGSMTEVQSPTILMNAVMRDAWGIFDQVKMSYHIPKDFKDILITGVADTVWGACFTVAEGGFGSSAYFSEIWGAKHTYVVNITQDDVDKVNAANDWKTEHILVPKGALGENSPPDEDTGCIAIMGPIFCWPEVDEEIVYELVKFHDEYADEWSRRLGLTAPRPEFMVACPGITEDRFHPGAIRYYREKNVKIGG